jgi:Ca2+-binding RTX toxin-like protein
LDLKGTPIGETLEGGPENEKIDGLAGDDTLNGGAGNDTFIGSDGDGNDTYLFGKGDGQDTISSYEDKNAARLNILKFKAAITPEDVIVTRSVTTPNNLILSFKDTTDSITVEDFFRGANVGSPNSNNYYNPIQQVTFADGTIWNLATLVANTFLGTADADTYTGFSTNDLIYGGAGNDILLGRDGNDTLDGGLGNDTLNGGNDSDLNSDGNDTYLFGKGDGQDIILSHLDAKNNKLNTLQFKDGITPSDVIVTRTTPNNLILSFKDTTDSIIVEDFFRDLDPSNHYNPIQQVTFNKGTVVWDLAILAAAHYYGTEGEDTLMGIASDDHIIGKAGDDTLEGRGGNDTLEGGPGNDTLDGGNKSDSDTGVGNDTYLFSKGDGQDTISPDWDTRDDRVNTLKFSAGIAPSDVIVTRSSTTPDNLILSFKDTTDSITVEDFFRGTNASSSISGNYYNPIQQVTFADGTIWNLARLVANTFLGTAGADTYTGFSTNDLIYGGDGDDNLLGGDGDDTLEGGPGNDTLNGGNEITNDSGDGSDTYLFGKGDGQDTIRSHYDASSPKLNTLQFKADITPSDIIVTRSTENPNNLLINLKDSTDSITVQDFFRNSDPSNNYNSVQQVKFNSDTVWNLATLTAKALNP